ncbi:MAG: PilZ domain-containing protein [Nitrospirae bacterium]|nr:PilZ domain-containing protein [Nitrospirota bacterium]
MLKIVCPKCQNDSYSADVRSFSECPHCGIVSSGQHGLDKRCEKRIEWEIPFIFSSEEQNFEASTFDLSEKGMGIKVFGELSVETGDAIDLSVGDLQLRAKVMWVQKMPDKFVAGLERLN